MPLGEKVYRWIDRVAHKIPAALVRPLSMPIGYHLQATDGFLYEGAEMSFTAFGYVANNKIKGDYVEFGVFDGRGIVEAYYCAEKFGLHGMRLWAFDSFSGLPEIKGEDDGGTFVEGEFSSSRTNFENNIRKYGVAKSRVEIVEGYFDKSLAQEQGNYPDHIAIAWVDCDLYESTVPVLQFLTDRLVDGAILIFDDWFCFNGAPDKGEQRACAEWLARNPEIRLIEYRNYHWSGKSFIFSKV